MATVAAPAAPIAERQPTDWTTPAMQSRIAARYRAERTVETLGMVYQPSWFTGFSLAIDAFDIRVKNAIVNVAGNDSVIQQACYASGGSSPYCTLQQRPNGYTDKSPSNAVTAWRTGRRGSFSSGSSSGSDISRASSCRRCHLAGDRSPSSNAQVAPLP